MAEKIVKDSQGLAKELVNDCISRRAAIDIVRFECGEWEGLAKTIIKRFEQLPSAQPEIIRCRDCRHWYTGDGYNHENGAQCALTHMWMSPDDYCSYGRRKVSETDG